MLKEQIAQFIDIAKEFVIQNHGSFTQKKNKHIPYPSIDQAPPSPQAVKKEVVQALPKEKTPLIEEKKWIPILRKYLPSDSIKERIPHAQKAPILLIATARHVQEKLFIKQLSHAIFSKMCRLEVIILKNSSLMPPIEKTRLLLITEDLVKIVPQEMHYLVVDYLGEKRALWTKIENFIALHLSS
jgi:hypothetical protein